MAVFPHLYLASASPRRQELLSQLGVEFVQIENNFDESLLANEQAIDYVKRLAKGKALSALSQRYQDFPILSADTIVVLDGHCLGKPVNLEQAKETLSMLSARTHQVHTAVCVHYQSTTLLECVTSEVTFMPLSDEIIDAYCQTKEPFGKAGSYAIQGIAASFISKLVGSYTSVVGLPLHETSQLLKHIGVETALSPFMAAP